MIPTELLVQNPWDHHGGEVWEEMRTVLDGNFSADIDKCFKS